MHDDNENWGVAAGPKGAGVEREVERGGPGWGRWDGSARYKKPFNCNDTAAPLLFQQTQVSDGSE